MSKDPQANGTRFGQSTTKGAPFPHGISYDRATNETKLHRLRRLNRPPVLLTQLEQMRWSVPPTTVVLPTLIRQSQSTRAINNGTTARLMRLNLAPFWRLKGAEPLSLTRASSVPNAVLAIDSLQTSRELVPGVVTKALKPVTSSSSQLASGAFNLPGPNPTDPPRLAPSETIHQKTHITHDRPKRQSSRVDLPDWATVDYQNKGCITLCTNALRYQSIACEVIIRK